MLALVLSGLIACAPSGGEPQDAAAQSAAESGEAGGTPARVSSAAADLPEGGDFDFYVLSLSWSPSYCEAEGKKASRQQCDAAHPHAFIVHGLWPQFENGYPLECGTSERNVADRTLRQLKDIMPSPGLVRHEWRTHGSCSGLAQDDYFEVLRAARKKVAIPMEFRRPDARRTLSPGEAEASFLQANPGLPPDGISVTCDRRYLRDVRICMTRELAFRPCAEIDRRACRLPKVAMPPVRGE